MSAVPIQPQPDVPSDQPARDLNPHRSVFTVILRDPGPWKDQHLHERGAPGVPALVSEAAISGGVGSLSFYMQLAASGALAFVLLAPGHPSFPEISAFG